MESLINLLAVALSEFAAPAERKYTGARRLAAAVAIAAIAVAVAGGALGCAIAALWIYLSSVLGPLAAAIGSTVMLLLVGVILAAVASSLFQDDSRTSSTKNVIRDELLQELHRGFERNKGAALLAALIAGLAAGSTTRGK